MTQTQAPRIDSFSDLAAYLDGLGMFRMKPGLSRIGAVFSSLGLLRPSFPVLHVLGTNGKGGTSLALAELLRAHGLRVGLSTSPHFVDVRERARINSRLIDADDWASAARHVLAQPDGLGLTYFEFLIAASVLLFQRFEADAAVMEAGLGGTYDATTALPAMVTVFAPIGLDHRHILGDTIGEIAADKAGAIRPGGIAVTGPQVPEAMVELERAAAERKARLIRVEETPAAGLDAPSDPPFHLANARLALAAFHVFAKQNGLSIDDDLCLRILRTVRPAGRFQRLPAAGDLPEIILDGAHNAHAMAALAGALRVANVRPTAVIFSCMVDKNTPEMRTCVLRLTDGPVYVPDINVGDRAAKATELAADLGPRAVAVHGMAAALDRVKDSPGPILLCGSLYMLADFYTLRPEALSEEEPVSIATIRKGCS